MSKSVVGHALSLTWWAIVPVFGVIVGGFVRDRAYFDRFNLMPSLSVRPALAILVSAFYVLAHAWLLAAYTYTVVLTHRLLPGLRPVMEVWRRDAIKLATAAAIFGIEYIPVAVWVSLVNAFRFFVS